MLTRNLSIMSEVAPIIDIIKKLTPPSDSDDPIRSASFKELDFWVTHQLKTGADEKLFSVAGALSKPQKSFYFGNLQTLIDYRPIPGGEAFVFGIPLFFPTAVPYELISQYESNIQDECLEKLANSGIFHQSCIVSLQGYLSDLSNQHSITPSTLYSMSTYLSLSEKLSDDFIPENDNGFPEIEAITKGFRLLQDRDRCLLSGSAYWFYEKINFGLVPPGSAEYDIRAAVLTKNIVSYISDILGIRCSTPGLLPFSYAVNHINTCHFKY
jgi:hypothetical protein